MCRVWSRAHGLCVGMARVERRWTRSGRVKPLLHTDAPPPTHIRRTRTRAPTHTRAGVSGTAGRRRPRSSRARTSPRGLLRTSLPHTPNAHSIHTRTHVGLPRELFIITINNPDAYGRKMDRDVFYVAGDITYARAQQIFYPHPTGRGVVIQVQVRVDEGDCECPGGCAGGTLAATADGVPRAAVVRTHSERAAAFGYDVILESREPATERVAVPATERVAVGTAAHTGGTQYACSFSFRGGVSSLSLVRNRYGFHRVCVCVCVCVLRTSRADTVCRFPPLYQLHHLTSPPHPTSPRSPSQQHSQPKPTTHRVPAASLYGPLERLP